MRFKLSFVPKEPKPIIPINYQYPLSAVIYKVLSQADKEYSEFLHTEGFSVNGGLKCFKLFTFSNLEAGFKLRGDRMHIHTNPELIVSFHLPEAAQHFIKGLFMNREIDIADQKSKATFLVEQVEAQPGLKNSGKMNSKVNFELLSMIICGKKDEEGNYEFLSPEHRDWDSAMLYNWKEKCRAAGLEVSMMKESNMSIEPVFNKKKPKSRLIVVKANTKAQTRIKGYYNFGIVATGSEQALEVLYNSGCGVYNSLGCGCFSLKPKKL